MKRNKIELTEEEKILIGKHFGAMIWNKACQKYKYPRRLFRGYPHIERRFYKLKKGGNPTLQTIFLFAKILGVSAKELVDFNISNNK